METTEQILSKNNAELSVSERILLESSSEKDRISEVKVLYAEQKNAFIGDLVHLSFQV